MKLISKNSNSNNDKIKVGPKYWKSLDELADSPDFKDWLHREFPQGASEIEGTDRRHFLKIMAASFAFAGLGLTGCRQPQRHILPYAEQPEKLIEGVPLFFSTSMPTAAENIPLIAETHSYRPTKIEGNPSYAPYAGATNVFSQASVLDLYDPDRSQASYNKDKKELSKDAVKDLLATIRKKYKANGGQGLAFLAEQSSSPTRRRLVTLLRKEFPEAVWSEYEPVNYLEADDSLGDVFGSKVRAHYDFTQAKRVLSLDCDFLQSEPGSLQYAREFTKSRKIQNAEEAHKMNRLYVVESDFSATGGMADHRLRASSSQVIGVAYLIASEVFSITGGDSSLVSYFKTKGRGLKIDEQWIKECAKDLVENGNNSLVVAGSTMPQELHLVTYIVNKQLNAIGHTVDYLDLSSEDIATSVYELADNIRSEKVSTLFILGGNPAYNTPGDLDWTALQEKVEETIRLGYYYDETSEISDYHIAQSHYLESWGDGRTWDGTYVPVQPMILPLFKTYAELEVLLALAGEEKKDSYDYIKETFQAIAADNSNLAFDKWLSEGVLQGSAFDKVAVTPSIKSVVSFIDTFNWNALPLSSEYLEVKFVPSNQVFDGRYNNNGWLQELPDSMTRLTWDNAILISPKLATELQEKTGYPILPDASLLNKAGQMAPDANNFKRGKEEAFVAEINVNGQRIKGPIHVHPGLADYTVVLNLGYGRKSTGRVGQGTGFDVYPLVKSTNPSYSLGAKLTLTDEIYKLANVQEHWSMEGRAIIREANVEDYQAEPDFVNRMGAESHSPPILGPDASMSLKQRSKETPRGNSLYETPEFKGPQQWGMVVDLNSCTSCSACVVACQSENNIPIVGKDQVLRGREMHWIRMDRYFSAGSIGGDELPQDPQVSFMGVMCQHCELAPCESVCPVNATVHDDQGLNVMAYNRCVGTRYCANNCPYKVRRFNFFDWNKREIGHFYEGPLGPVDEPEIGKMQKNPNVTIRMRGVMEKCTYCVQRIESAKINQLAKAQDSAAIKIEDGVIKTACQQVCPTGAITFGDIADETTEVSELKQSDRNYSLLGYLNIRPRTTYLAKVRNPNPLMPDYSKQPLSRQEYEGRYGHGAHHEEHATH